MTTGSLSRGVGLDDALARVDALEEEARHRALHDPLTGLPNRTLFVDRSTTRSRSPAATAAPPRCSGSTSTASRSSTTATATNAATSC